MPKGNDSNGPMITIPEIVGIVVAAVMVIGALVAAEVYGRSL